MDKKLLYGRGLVVVGKGNVGNALINELDSIGANKQVLAVLSSKGAEIKNRNNGQFRFEDGMTLTDVVDRITRLGLDPVVIDVSNNSDPNFHSDLSNKGITIVTANKVPAAMLEAKKAFELMQKTNYGYDATVMAGKGLIPELMKLKNRNKEGIISIESIEGIFSGTLAYITKELAKGVPLSYAIKKAMELGYTEPNPMDDLDGKDVAKKLVIIARTLGYEVNIEDVEVEGLLDDNFRKIFLDIKAEVEIEFAGQDEKLIKKEIRDRFALCIKKAGIDEQYSNLLLKNKRKVPRYIASITFEDGQPKLKAKIQFVDSKSEMGVAESNKVVIKHTAGLEEEPLIKGGKGAGPIITSLGVINDLERILTK